MMNSEGGGVCLPTLPEAQNVSRTVFKDLEMTGNEAVLLQFQVLSDICLEIRGKVTRYLD
jgi:hypothetical protein